MAKSGCPRLPATIAVALMTAVCTGCLKPEPLDKGTALRLVESKTIAELKLPLPNKAAWNTPAARSLSLLSKEGVIRCSSDEAQIYCLPGWGDTPADPRLPALIIDAGRLVVRDIGDLSQIDDRSATARLLLDFVPTPTYLKHKATINALARGFEGVPTADEARRTTRFEDSVYIAFFARSRRRWRLERIDSDQAADAVPEFSSHVFRQQVGDGSPPNRQQ